MPQTPGAPPSLPLGLQVRRKLEVLGAAGLTWYVRHTTRPKALAAADRLARTAYRAPILRRNMRTARQTLEIAFPTLTPAEHEALLVASIRTLSRTMVDFLRFPLYGREGLRDLLAGVEGTEHLAAFDASEHGAVVGLGLHLGSWEFTGAYIGLDHPMVAVGKAQNEGYITALAVDTRTASGIDHVLSNRTGSKKLIATLKRTDKAILGLMADQNGGRDGLFVPFFDTSASAIRGPAFLMRRYGVPGIGLCGVWEGDRYRVLISPLIHSVQSDDAEQDILLTTARIQSMYEALIRRYPEQWLWLHKRWKTRPEIVPEAERASRILTPEAFREAIARGVIQTGWPGGLP